MNKKRTILVWAISLTVILFALSLVIQLVDEVGPPILLDPDHKLEIPPPPKSMYQMGKESKTQPSAPADSRDKKR